MNKAFGKRVCMYLFDQKLLEVDWVRNDQHGEAVNMETRIIHINTPVM